MSVIKLAIPRKQDLLPLSRLKQTELELVEWRSGVKASDCIYDGRAKICSRHYQV